MKLAGIILIVLGIVAFCYQYVPITETKHDAQLGPINISHQETHDVPIPPIIGGVLVVAGVAALVLGARNKS
jgi:UDP-N-acetylmuramyl pentapeptide phosphotransferase/UDP-N-acetylglucosamine-1-phosphate transferase